MVGSELGSYRIERELGRGGMGVVYVGAHVLLRRSAAIKVLLPKYSRDEEIVQRFFNEARAAAAIKHPGIVEIYDFGHAADGSAYIVMELCEGESLASRVRKPLSMAKAVTIARHIAGTLAAAHRAGIIHRDLKPDNVFLVPDPDVAGRERIKLLDFGIAKLASDSEGPSKTATGVIMGTPNYMSPEQCRGAGQIDPRSDLYSLGIILFELVCGRLPFSGEGSGDIIAAHLNALPPSPRSLVPGTPTELDRLLSSLLAKKPADRPENADAVVAELERLLPTIPETLSTGGRTRDASPLAETLPSDQQVDALAPTASTTPPRGELVQPAPVAPTKPKRPWPWLAAGALAIAASIAFLVLRGGVHHTPPAAPMVWEFAGDPIEVMPGSEEPRLNNSLPTGAFGKRWVRDNIQWHRANFAYCYDHVGLTTNAVTINLAFTISLAGEVTDTSIDYKDEQLAGCIANVARAMRFPKPPAEVHVVYPLTFLIGPPAR